MKKAAMFAIVCACLSLFSAGAQATLIRAMSLAEMVAESDVIVVAQAEARRARRDDTGRILTDVSIRVMESWKGSSGVGAILVMTEIGGTMGDLTMRIEGEPALRVGDRYVLFLDRWSQNNNVLRPVGMTQGVLGLRASTSASGDDVVLPGGAGLAVVRPGRNGSLVATQPAFSTTSTLDEVRMQVTAEIEAQRAH